MKHHTRTLRTMLKAFSVAALTCCAIAAAPAIDETQQAHADLSKGTIESVEDLTAFASNVNDGKTTYSGKTITLETDLNLTGISWTPIGKTSTYNDSAAASSFRGTFDGNGHTITGLAITSFEHHGDNGPNTVGLFGTTNGATIKNLNLTSVSIEAKNWSNSLDLACGSLVGLAVDTTITNCNIYGLTLKDSTDSAVMNENKNYAVGGLVGDSINTNKNAAITSCNVTKATISSNTYTKDYLYPTDNKNYQIFTGGLVGRLRTQTAKGLPTLTRCNFSGTIKANGFVGPLAAGARNGAVNDAKTISEDAAKQLTDCYYTATFSYDGSSNSVNPAFNTGANVWGNGYSKYLKATEVSTSNMNEALNGLNSAGAAWRIATPTGEKFLSLDFRSVKLGEATYENNKAEFSYTQENSGYYDGTDRTTNPLIPSWEVTCGNTATTSTEATLEVPLASVDQTVTLKGARAFGASTDDSKTVEGVTDLSLTITKERNASKVVTKLTAALTATNQNVDLSSGFTYQWYGISEDGSEVTLNEQTNASLNMTDDLRNTYTSFKCSAKSSAEAINGSYTLQASASAVAVGTVVYVQYSGGSDNNDGTINNPVKTLQGAYTVLEGRDDAAKTRADTIVIMDNYTDVSYGTNNTTFNLPATITSYDEETTTDFRAKSQARLSLHSNSNDSTAVAQKLLFADTSFKNITLFGGAANSTNAGSQNIGYIYCQGHSLTMDIGVIMQGYRYTSKAAGYGLLSSSKSFDFNIIGGYFNYNEQPGTGYTGDPCNIVVKSGSYSRVIAGGRNFPIGDNNGVNAISHNQFGSENKPFQVSITVDVSEKETQRNGAKGDGTNFNCDIAQLCGGQTDGTIYANSTLTIKNGVVPLVLGSSIGFRRAVGGGYPNNDFVGTATINLEGGMVSQLYGGCLGRSEGSSNILVDSRFKSLTNTEGPDITINVSNGSVGPISDIGKESITGIFAAGAGGITGEIDQNTGSVTNDVEVQVNISGGTVSGNLYGGGYGQSTGVTTASTVCLEAGNLYGNSTVNITGGTIDADVYGGGAGTTAYLAGNQNTNALAQIVGNVKLNISNATINGSVYGGSKGALATGFDCSSMAKITGDVALNIDNANIAGSVYGGSAFGAITGNAATAISDSNTVDANTIGGSVYGGGQGERLNSTSLMLDRQTAIGQIGGNAGLYISNYTVTGSVFGGGAIGAVLGADGVSTTLENVTVGGSVYGGGQGALLDSYSVTDAAAIQAILGQVAGNAALSLTGGSIGKNVYGGGSMGAVLGNAGSSTDVQGANVAGSVFGAGEGAIIENNSNTALQKVVGQVKSGASLSLTNNASVEGNVYGGGDLGVAGDGSLTTGDTPYEINTAATITLYINKATVGGSVFGAGAGDAGSSGQTPRMLGAVFGTSSTTVHEATIGLDIFGGGDQSYSYAPLTNGRAQQATKVVINGGTSVFVDSEGALTQTDENAITVDSVGEDLGDNRSITIGGSVFGAANVDNLHGTTAVNTMVFGSTDVYIKGTGVVLTDEAKGGIYGDGNLSLASGTRYVTLINLRNLGSNTNPKNVCSLQRADRVVVNDCNIMLKGASDRVNSGDTTKYSVNRITNLKLYNNSTLQFDTVVNGLNNLWSDILPNRTFTGSSTAYGDNVTDDEKASYRTFSNGQAKEWISGTGSSKETHTTTNSIIVNNGKWLDVKESSDSTSASPYGNVTGLFSITSDTSDNGSGGAFVFGRSKGNDSTGTFISLNTEKDKATYLELYTETVADNDSHPCRIWYIKGSSYTYAPDLKAYTTGEDATITVFLPVAYANAASLSVDGAIESASTLESIKRSDSSAYQYAVDMTLGSTIANKSTRPLYNVPADGTTQKWSYNYADYVPKEGDTAVIPAQIKLSFKDLGTDEEVKTQEGIVSFTLKSDDGTTYTFRVNVIIEDVRAYAYERVHYGSVYEDIAVENAAAITSTSSYTSQFTTTYSPGAYRGGVEAHLSTTSSNTWHNPNDQFSGSLPAGTRLTMIDTTNAANPQFYSYTCTKKTTDIALTQFASLSGGEKYRNKTGSTVVIETLLFVVDYSNVSNGQTNGQACLTLEHLYNGRAKDILSYSYTDENNVEQKSYNTLWNNYTIEGTDASYLNAEDLTEVVTSHTDNFMYDTYTTKLAVSTDSNTMSTAYNESSVSLAIKINRDVGNANNITKATLPLGSQILVTKKDGSSSADPLHGRYYYDKETNQGYYLVDLGTRPNGIFSIELRVQRYLKGGTLYDAFTGTPPAWGQVGFSLDTNLYRSADGLYFGSEGRSDSIIEKSIEFNAARKGNDAPPTYELANDTKKLLSATAGEVSGTLVCSNDKNAPTDTSITVLRKPNGSTGEAEDIVAKLGTGTVTQTSTSNPLKFTIKDKPAAGTWEYEIRVGNTVYYETVTVS